MERERPEYLPPIKPRRWSFPWLTFIAAILLTLAAFTIKQHVDTQVAWNQRFAQPKPAPAVSAQTLARAEADARAHEAEIQLIVAARKAELAKWLEEQERERKTWRCIDHIPFRKVNGAWENVPDERC